MGLRKMTLSGGLYSHAWNKKQKLGEKHWPPLSEEKKYYKFRMFMHECGMENSFDSWLTKCKPYSAEYYQED